MGTVPFEHDDDGYAAWLNEHRAGYVLNIQRTLNPSDARMHAATCWTINGTPPRGSTFTGEYIKVCAESLVALDTWALEHAGAAIRRCGKCQPPGTGAIG